MAPKRPLPLEKPPAVSSSEEEEEVESSSSEEEEAEEEEQQEQKHHHKKASSSSIPPPAPAVNKKPATQPHSSSDDDDDEDDEGSESDSDHPPPVPNVKPIASKPMDVDGSSKVLKKPARSKPASTAAAAATPTKSSSKRSVANSGGEVKESSRANKKQKGAEADAAKTAEVEKKKAAAAAGEGSKKPSFQRVWSEEDEIAILEGIMDYSKEKGIHPATDLDGFYHFIKKMLHHDAARTQLLDKIRKLKKKFEINAAKGKNGEDPIITKPHDKKIYDLSKIIWGKDLKANASAKNGGGGDQVDQPKPNGKAKQNREPLTVAEKEKLLASLRPPPPKDAPSPSKEAEEPNAGHSNELSSIMFDTSIVGGGGGLVESFVKDGLALIDSAKMSELEEKWRKLREAEAETSLRRIELVQEQAKLILDAYKNQRQVK